jgi:hypothetical protein
MPRSAAADFARLKSASGISTVVFILIIVPYLWESVSVESFAVTHALSRLFAATGA